MAGRLHGMNVTPQATTTAAPTALSANATKPGSISLRWTQSTTRVSRRTARSAMASMRRGSATGS
jgi:hypothetical protein